MCTIHPIYRWLLLWAKGSQQQPPRHPHPTPPPPRPGASASGPFLSSHTKWKQPEPGTLSYWLKFQKQTNNNTTKQTKNHPGPAFILSKERTELIPALWMCTGEQLPAASSSFQQLGEPCGRELGVGGGEGAEKTLLLSCFFLGKKKKSLCNTRLESKEL